MGFVLITWWFGDYVFSGVGVWFLVVLFDEFGGFASFEVLGVYCRVCGRCSF